jgi:hypothetical protein
MGRFSYMWAVRVKQKPDWGTLRIGRAVPHLTASGAQCRT